MSHLSGLLSVGLWLMLASIAAGEWSRGHLDYNALGLAVALFGLWATVMVHEVCVAIRGSHAPTT